MSLQDDARLGTLSAIAFDMFAKGVLAPAPDPRLSPEWQLRGYITAMDTILSNLGPMQLGGKEYYGFLVESIQNPGEFVATIRGTADLAEWAIDADFRQVPHHCGGMVEEGFSGLYQTMRYQPLSPAGAPDSPMVPGIARAVGQGKLTVLGHSLGAALATLAVLDLTLIHDIGENLRGVFLASPRVGDQTFADIFACCVHNAVGYALAGDVVPQVPAGMGYTPVRCTTQIGTNLAQALIKNSKTCLHHVYSYLSSMDFSLMDWRSVPACDRDLTACILGPISGAKAP